MRSNCVGAPALLKVAEPQKVTGGAAVDDMNHRAGLGSCTRTVGRVGLMLLLCAPLGTESALVAERSENSVEVPNFDESYERIADMQVACFFSAPFVPNARARLTDLLGLVRTVVNPESRAGLLGTEPTRW